MPQGRRGALRDATGSKVSGATGIDGWSEGNQPQDGLSLDASRQGSERYSLLVLVLHIAST